MALARRASEKWLKVGNVSVPASSYAVARTGVLGIVNSGKTVAAKGIAEQLMDAGVPIVVFDAIGAWRWLKVPAEGGKGWPVVVAGGAAPDLPLTVQSAPAIVRAAVHEGVSLVIDLYDPRLSKADWRRIVESCFNVLLFENRGVRHVFLEESAEYAPQQVRGDGAVYAAIEKLARMGGNVGVGITFVNQRAQELNKAVLELCDNLVLLRQRGSHAITALEKWLGLVAPDVSREVAASLPNLKAGECWVWTEDSDEPFRTRTSLCRSFHPERKDRGARQAAARKAVDAGAFVEKLSVELAAVIAEAKKDDPKELRRQIAELTRELKARPAVAPATVVTAVAGQAVARAVKQAEAQFRAQVAPLQRAVQKSSKHIEGAAAALAEARLALEGCTALHSGGSGGAAEAKSPEKGGGGPTETRAAAPVAKFVAPKERRGEEDAPTEVPNSLLNVLRGLAFMESTGFEECSRAQLAAVVGLSPKASTLNVYLSKLSAQSYIECPPGKVKLTEQGRAVAPEPDRFASRDELHALWIAKFDPAVARVLRVLLDQYPNHVQRGDIADALGLSRTASTLNVYISKLSKHGIVDTGRGTVRASDVLFPSGLD